MLGEVSGSGYRQAPSLVRRADGRTIQLTPLLYPVLEEINGTRDLDAVAAAVAGALGLAPHRRRHRVPGRAEAPPARRAPARRRHRPAVAKANPLLALRLQAHGLPSGRHALDRSAVRADVPAAGRACIPRRVRLRGVVGRVRARPRLGGAAGAVQPLLAAGRTRADDAVRGLPRLGHAAACRYGGAKPGAMGVGSTWSGRRSTPTSPTRTASAAAAGCASTSAGSTSTPSLPSPSSARGRTSGTTRCCSSSRRRSSRWCGS